MAEKFTKGVDYIGVCVVYFCHDGAGNFVMAKRSNKTRDEHGRWDIGGGGMEFGDTVEDTLRKEIAEEYCTDILNFEFLGYRDVHRQHNGQPTHWMALDFNVQVDPTKVKNGEPTKFDDVKWFTFNALPKAEQMHSNMPTFFSLYRKKLEGNQP